ncbi:MAG: dihydroorotase [Methanosaeta sp. PtaB.Bin039]|nr:MAG: dihydroorotase [Methanosaeta sp. PtaB.Bin039]
MDLQIRGGRVFMGKRVQVMDIWIKDGRIAALGGPHVADDHLDVAGLLVLPGAVDIHVHFRDPGQTHKEDWETGSLAAAAGGVTTVVDQPNTLPAVNDASAYRDKLITARRHSIVDFCLNGGPGNVQELLGEGAAAIGEIFTYEMGEERLRDLLFQVEDADGLPTIHAEDGWTIRRCEEGMRGQQDPDVHSRSRPPQAEEAAIAQALSLTQKRVHICHLSTSGGLELIRRAKKAGRAVTAEVAPHHLLLNRRDYRKQGTFLKVNPPLRSSSDNQALWDGLRRGDIEAMASDHAPHLPEEKRQEIWEAPSGLPGVETMLPLMLDAVRANRIPLDRAVDALSTAPARILGLKGKGEIAVGKDADLVLVDTRARSEVLAYRLHSRADWTPYQGRTAIFPRLTMVRGEVVFDGDMAVRPGYGQNLPGPGRSASRVREED